MNAEELQNELDNAERNLERVRLNGESSPFELENAEEAFELAKNNLVNLWEDDEFEWPSCPNARNCLGKAH
jgi:uncharacterized protein YajQ (UPF0234 family)